MRSQKSLYSATISSFFLPFFIFFSFFLFLYFFCNTTQMMQQIYYIIQSRRIITRKEIFKTTRERYKWSLETSFQRDFYQLERTKRIGLPVLNSLRVASGEFYLSQKHLTLFYGIIISGRNLPGNDRRWICLPYRLPPSICTYPFGWELENQILKGN